MNPKYEITLEEIVEKYNLKLLLIFGSYGTDRYKADSDIDIAFLSYSKNIGKEELNLATDMARYFKKSDIDIVNLRKANIIVRYEAVTKATKILYDKENYYEAFRLATLKMFQEMKPYIDRRVESIRERIRNT